jgi:hypothetical protein
VSINVVTDFLELRQGKTEGRKEGSITSVQPQGLMRWKLEGETENEHYWPPKRESLKENASEMK